MGGRVRACSKNQAPHRGAALQVLMENWPHAEAEGRQRDLSREEGGDFVGGEWGQGCGVAIASPSASRRSAQPVMSLAHQFVLLGCSGAPNVASAMQGRPTGVPLL